MGSTALQLLQPQTLAGLATLELVARSAVEGFFQGLHRSPKFGFSQEFAEYRAYSEGDDPRFVDWNVFARTERTYIKRFQGETNTRLTLAVDASASMGFGSGPVNKLRYAKFLAASLAYLAIHQHDAVGLIAFDSAIRSYRPPSSRSGALSGILHALDALEPGSRTDIGNSLRQLREHTTRRGLVAVISDLYCDPVQLTRSLQPLAYHGHDILIFHVLDRQELEPSYSESVLLEDMESGETLDVSPDYLKTTYREKLARHFAQVKRAAAGLGAGQVLLVTDEPLDKPLRAFLAFRGRR